MSEPQTQEDTMTHNNERDDELFGIIYGATDKPEWAVSEVHDAILAAGYVKPRQVTTVEELDALTGGSVILCNKGEDSAQKDCEGFWYLWGGDVALESAEMALPATVLHVGSL